MPIRCSYGLDTFLADARHNGDLCALMRDVAMPGAITLIFGRQPDFFHGLDVQGKFNQVGVSYAGTQLAGMGCRSVKPMYIQGKEVDFGYLHALRRSRAASGGVTAAIFRLLREVHEDQRAPGYLTTVIAGNDAAMRAMVQSRNPLMPHFFDLGTYHVHAIFLNRRRRPHHFASGVRIVRGDAARLLQIVEFLQKQGARRQFFPHYTAEDFTAAFTRGFAPEDFYLAFKKDTLVGVIGVWDQSSYKQHQIAAYSGVLKARKVINFGLKGLGYPGLPEVGQKLSNVSLSFVSIEGDEPALYHQLIDAIYQDYKTRDYSLIFAGFHARDPLRFAVQKYRSVVYNSQLFLTCWDDGLSFCRPILRDERVPYLELATM